MLTHVETRARIQMFSPPGHCAAAAAAAAAALADDEDAPGVDTAAIADAAIQPLCGLGFGV